MALRLLETMTYAGQTVKIYRDAEWQEWRVRLYPEGRLHAPADYHTSDKADALHAAGFFLNQLVNSRSFRDIEKTGGAE